MELNTAGLLRMSISRYGRFTPPAAAVNHRRTMKLIDIIDATPIPFGYRIAFLTNFYREPLLRQMEREYGIIRPEWTVLICLNFRDGTTAKDICEITEQPSNTVSRAVTALTEKGLITRKTDKQDARRSLLFITAVGQQLYDNVMQIFISGENKMISCLSPKEHAQLDLLLEKLCRHVPKWTE